MKAKLLRWLYYILAQTALFGPLAVFGVRKKYNMDRYLRFQQWWNPRFYWIMTIA